ncbi:hypothetical protein [Dyadobacter fermentans]|uniref:hypothetical protein n=1 Tax=Dyadobacter fermentans TaxID=94254 RepID=UPI001651969C|nr:hypothetical protein [Dyadobacter fermentans]
MAVQSGRFIVEAGTAAHAIGGITEFGFRGKFAAFTGDFCLYVPKQLPALPFFLN